MNKPLTTTKIAELEMNSMTKICNDPTLRVFDRTRFYTLYKDLATSWQTTP